MLLVVIWIGKAQIATKKYTKQIARHATTEEEMCWQTHQ